jgi:hypothetical protein
MDHLPSGDRKLAQLMRNLKAAMRKLEKSHALFLASRRRWESRVDTAAKHGRAATRQQRGSDNCTPLQKDMDARLRKLQKLVEGQSKKSRAGAKRKGPYVGALLRSDQHTADITPSALFAPPADGKVITQHGKGVTIWKKQACGAWKCVVDIWNSLPPVS